MRQRRRVEADIAALRGDQPADEVGVAVARHGDPVAPDDAGLLDRHRTVVLSADWMSRSLAATANQICFQKCRGFMRSRSPAAKRGGTLNHAEDLS